MDNTDVPLWAFLLVGLAAVVGPWLTTRFTNKNALKISDEQNKNALLILEREHKRQRQAWVMDRRIDAYKQALNVLEEIGWIDLDERPPEPHHRKALLDAFSDVSFFGIKETALAMGNVIQTFMPLFEDIREDGGNGQAHIEAFYKAREEFQSLAVRDIRLGHEESDTT